MFHSRQVKLVTFGDELEFDSILDRVGWVADAANDVQTDAHLLLLDPVLAQVGRDLAVHFRFRLVIADNGDNCSGDGRARWRTRPPEQRSPPRRILLSVGFAQQSDL